MIYAWKWEFPNNICIHCNTMVSSAIGSWAGAAACKKELVADDEAGINDASDWVDCGRAGSVSPARGDKELIIDIDFSLLTFHYMIECVTIRN